jgi:uncharacterized Zn finger protein
MIIACGTKGSICIGIKIVKFKFEFECTCPNKELCCQAINGAIATIYKVKMEIGTTILYQ